MNERAMLMQLVDAADGVEPDWQDALTRAGYRGRYLPDRSRPLIRRRVLVLVAAALAAIYVVSAVAADRRPFGLVYRLVDRSDETYPVHQVPELGNWVERKRATFFSVPTKNGGAREVKAIPVIQGTIAGHRFEMSAYHRKQPFSAWDGTRPVESDEDRLIRELKAARVYVGFSLGGPAEKPFGVDYPSMGDGMAGPPFPVHGLAEPRDGDAFHWVSIAATYTGQGPITKDGVGRGPKWLFGVANPKVARVDLENTNDGTVVSVPTIEPPEGLPARMRFWIAALRLDQLVHVVVPRDKDGDSLERWELTQAF